MDATERVGIPVALDGRGQQFGRTAIDQEPQPFQSPLRCGGCSAPVTSTRSHPRRKPHSSETYKVLAFYRLKSGNEHEPSCLYHFDARAGELVSEYRREIERHGDHFVLLLRDPALPGTVADADPPPADPRSRLEIQPHTGVAALHRTLSAASAIARLLRTFENDPQAQSAFQASYRGRIYSWEDIYFDTAHDIARLVHTIEEDEAQTGQVGSSHPLVVRGAVLEPAEPSVSGYFHRLFLDSRRDATESQKHAVDVALLTGTPASLLPYQKGDEILAYGLWRTVGRTFGSRTVQVSLWCDNHGATAKVMPGSRSSSLPHIQQDP